MSRIKILHITSPEHGQSNVHLAVISSLKQQYGNRVEIHLASFESFRHRVPEGVTFHPIFGRQLTSNFKSIDGVNISQSAQTLSDAVTSTPGFFGAIRGIMKMTSLLHAEPPEEYIATAKSVEELLGNLQLTLVVVENFLDAARDAVVRRKQPYVLLTPNTLKEVAAGDQGFGLFSWPGPAAGYPYPLPAYLFLPNALLFLFFPIWLRFFDARYATLQRHRHAAGYTGDWPIFSGRDPSHDFGNRAEWLRVGKWGNRKSAPRCNSNELAECLLSVLGRATDDLEAQKYRTRGQEISGLLMHKTSEVGGERHGREIAAEVIWNKAEDVYYGFTHD